MIVKCEQCQTRFKIPDDKVTEKGVKVRCTKCQHTFRVAKDGQAMATAQVPAFPKPAVTPGAADPFAAFGGASPIPPDEATRPGMMQVTLSPSVPENAGFFDDDRPTRVAPLPKNLGAMMRPPKGPLGLTSPDAASPGPGGQGDPFAFALGASPLPATRPQPAWDAGNPFEGAAADPFASFGGPGSAPPNAATQPVLPAVQSHPDTSAWTQPHAVYPQPPEAFTPPAPPPAWDAAVTFTGASPAGSQKTPAYTPEVRQPSAAQELPAQHAAAQQPAAWDFAAAVAPEPKAPSPFDFSGSSLRDEKAPPTWTTQPPMPAHVPASDPFAPPGGSMPSAAAPYDDPGDNEPTATATFAPAAPAPAAELPPFDSHGFGAAASASASDAGGGAWADGGSADASSAFAAGGSSDASSLFGAPGTSLSGEPLPPPQGQGESISQPIARLNLQQKTAAELAAEAAREIAEAEAADGVPPPITAPDVPIEAMPPPRGVLGVVGNITVAALLMAVVLAVGTVYYNEGKIEAAAFSVARFKEYFSSKRDFVTVDLSNGLYDTRGGHPVFFVRGEVINKSGKEAKVAVRAEIFDGEQLVRHADGWAGATPNLEELHAITAAADVDRLNEKLGAAAKPLADGANGHFLVPFYEYPADLKGIRVKVVVSGAEPAKAAAR